MNLANCINAEWAQSVSRRRAFPLSPNLPIPSSDPGLEAKVREHAITDSDKDEQEIAPPENPRGGGIGGSILKVLAGAREPLIVSEIADRSGTLSATQVGTNIHWLLKRGDVRRTGLYGYYTYRITAKGRKRIE